MAPSPESLKHPSPAPPIVDMSRRRRLIRHRRPPVPVNPCTVEEIVDYIIPRRHGVLMALTSEADKFFAKCCSFRAQGQEKLYLSGFANRKWEVQPKSELSQDLLMPVELKDIPNILTNEWVAKVARACHAWLYTVAFTFSSKLSDDERNRLIDELQQRRSVESVMRAWTTGNFITITSKRTLEQIRNRCSLCSLNNV